LRAAAVALLLVIAAPARAELVFSKSATGPAAIGGKVVYTISVVRQTMLEKGVVVHDPPPANQQLTTVDVPGQGSFDCSSGGSGTVGAAQVVCAAAGSGELQVTLPDTGPQYTVQPSYRVLGSTAQNSATATCTSGCITRMASATATIAPAKLVLQKTASVQQVMPGGTFDYFLTVTNNESSDLIGVTLHDALPAGITVSGVDSVVPSTVTMGAGTVDITPQVLPQGTSTFTLHAKLDPSAPLGTLTNTATVTAMGAAPVMKTLPLTVTNAPAPLSLAKVAAQPSLKIGAVQTYTLTVTPNKLQPGPITLVDPLDPSLKLGFLQVDGQPIACSPAPTMTGIYQVSCGTDGKITVQVPAGQVLATPMKVQLQATVLPTAPPKLSNVATLTDAAGGVQQATAITTVEDASTTGATVVVTAGKVLAMKGDLVPFVVTVGVPAGAMPMAAPTLVLATTPGLRVGDVRLIAPDGSVSVQKPTELNGALQLKLPTLPAGTTLSAQVRARVNDRAQVQTRGGQESLSAQLANGGQLVAGASAHVRIIADPEFDLGTLLGDVYRDDNGNGVRDRGERGIEGATVVMDDGLSAVTDAEGRYHLASIVPGDRAIKVARHTLPPGASFTTDETRVVQITPGSLTRLDFGIRVPAITVPTLPRPHLEASPLPELGLRDAGGLAYRLTGQAAVGGRVLVEGKEAHVDRKTGAWFIDVILRHGRSRFSQVTAWPDGRVVVSARDVYWVDRAQGGSLIVPRDEDPHLVLQFPPAALADPAFTLEGEVLHPIAGLAIAGATLLPDGKGHLALKLRLPESGAGIAVDARFSDGLAAKFDHVQSAGGDFFLLVGLAEGKLGFVQRDGVAAQGKDQGLFAEGRVKLYAKGRIQGRWLLEGALDLDSTQIDSWRDLFRADPTKMFRNLDPDRFYTVYGDSSQTTANAQSRARLYVRIQLDRSELLFGNLQTGLTGVELGRYSRAVTGGRLSYVRASVDDPNGPPTTQVILFGAWLQTQRAHDELRGTGGSLFYLSHKTVVEGSEQVRIEIRDKISARPVANLTQRANADYEIDYLAGRLMLRDPLSSVSANPSLIRATNMDGDAAYLVVDYEYIVDGDVDDGSVGMRATQKLGPVRLGGTVVNEIRAGPAYTLLGGDLQIDLKRWGTIVGEYAHSYGALSSFSRSDDGGLSYANAEGASQAAATKREGNAWKAEADLHGWGVVDFHPYARGVDQGYTDTAHAQDAGYLQFGGELGVKFWRLQLRAHYDEQRWDQQAFDAAGMPLYDALGQALYQHQTRRDAGGEVSGVFGRYQLRLGARTERADDTDETRAGHRSTVGARLDVRVAPRLTLYGAGQYALEHGGGEGLLALDNSLGAIGFIADLGFGTKLNAEGSYGAQGAGGLLGLKSEIGPGRVVYGTVTLSQDRDDRLISTVAAGGRQRIDDRYGHARALLFAEDQFRDGPVGSCVAAYTPASCDGAGRAHVLATGLDIPIAKKLVFGATFERGEVTPSGTPLSPGANTPIDRTAGTAYVSYGGERLRVQARGELRSDTLPSSSTLPGLQPGAASSALQWLASGMATLKATRDLTLRAKAFYSRSTDPTSQTLARSSEVDFGFSWRPTFTDRVALLGRYTFLDEFTPLPAAAATAVDPVTGRPLSLRERSHVASLATDGRLIWRFSLGEKIAVKRKEEPTLGTADWFILWVNRLSFHVTRRWDAVAEYRLLTVPGLTVTHGVSLEANVIVVGHLRLGAGWNFADFSDNELSLGRGSEKGFFIHAEGFY
jgi:uncharacterized repeat protein (TIGR01451 family)